MSIIVNKKYPNNAKIISTNLKVNDDFFGRNEADDNIPYISKTQQSVREQIIRTSIKNDLDDFNIFLKNQEEEINTEKLTKDIVKININPPLLNEEKLKALKDFLYELSPDLFEGKIDVKINLNGILVDEEKNSEIDNLLI